MIPPESRGQEEPNVTLHSILRVAQLVDGHPLFAPFARRPHSPVMNRRTFSRLGASALLLGRGHDLGLFGAALDRAGGWPRQEVSIDGARLNRRLAELRRFGGTPDGGTTRLAYSDEDLAARAWLSERMREVGLEVSVDLAGNLVGRREGTDPLPAIMVGSHIDSVPGGGSYDGQVGSMAALEIATALDRAGAPTRHPLELVFWANEEGGKTGSRVIAGEAAATEREIPTASGYTIGEGTRRLGGDPDRWGEARRSPDELTAYFELHIEQGAILDRAGIDIGVVEGIVGIRRWNATVTGFTNHAGTTPMNQRRDAMVTAARIIPVVNRIARDTPGRQVATVGRLEADPGAPNVVPGRVTFSLEIRDLEMAKIDAVFEEIRAQAEVIARSDGTTVAFEPFYLSRAAPTDLRLRDVIEEVATDAGLSSLRMPSGAGHDAQSVALLAPVGMIFVPSHEGISHSPLEFTAPEQITAGAETLLRSLLRVDESGLG